MTKEPDKKRKYTCPHCGASIAIGEKTKWKKKRWGLKLERRKTLKFANAIAGMISSYEYEAKKIKPKSYAASCVADKYTRRKGEIDWEKH